MKRFVHVRRARAGPLAAVVAAFFAGVLVDGYLRTNGPPIPESVRARLRSDAAGAPNASTASRTAAARSPDASSTPAVAKPSATSGAIPHTALRVPIDGTNVEAWKGAFDERRGGGSRGHEAVDILAPRNTPVHAVENGTIAKIFESKQGGHTVYQFSPDAHLAYYYAHLERYADGLHEGESVSQGAVIGYVGTSGNAPPDTPHLHFAIFELGPDKHWWQGKPLDPYFVFKQASETGS